MSVGALEPQFYDVFVELLGIKDAAPDRYDPEKADELRALIADTFRQKTQDEWCAVFDGTDACVAPILPMSKALHHPHIEARGTFVEKDGLAQPAPAPALLAYDGDARPASVARRRAPHPRGAGGVGHQGRRRAA